MEDRFDSFGLESPFASEHRPWPVTETPREDLAWLDSSEAENSFEDLGGEELCEAEAQESEDLSKDFSDDFASDFELPVEEEWKDLGPADIADDAIAQQRFSARVRSRIEPLLPAKAAASAAKWNAQRHPRMSGVAAAALLARLDLYVDRAAVEGAMRKDAGLAPLVSDPHAVLAVLAHQFQHKIYAAPSARDGKIGEGTLDALGFVRHRDRSLNPVDQNNVSYHVANKTKAYQRVVEAYRTDRAQFAALGSDVTPANWYYLFVNPPFLGRPFVRGVHIELMRKLRQAERWLISQPAYTDLSPAEIGAKLGVDEDHRGGRATNNTSMHTLGLAVDIGYVKNPWVAGQADSPNRNAKFQAATANAALLLTGRRSKVTPAFLASLGNDPAQTTGRAYDQIRERHDQLLEYLGLQGRPAQLRLFLQQRQRDGGTVAREVIGPGASIEQALARWRNTIAADRAALRSALAGGSPRDPANGFLNLHRDLVIALRDHGCLAWGGIDLGSNQSGDMMHFDCRADGIGYTLSLPIQRTAGTNHLCRTAPSAARKEAFETERENEEDGEQPSSATSYLGGRLWTFVHRPSRATVTIFVPPAALGQGKVELLLYVHGLLGPCGRPPGGARALVASDMFRLGRHVVDSRRPLCLIVPQFQDGGDASWETKGLHQPVALNRLLGDCLAEIGRATGAAAAPDSAGLIIAGHSKAYEVMFGLARAHASLSLRQGVLGGLREIWSLDATYGFPAKAFDALLAVRPELKVTVVYRTPGKTDRFDGKSARGRLTLAPLRASAVKHCAVPAYALPALLSGNDVPPTSAETGYATFAENELDSVERYDPVLSGEALAWIEGGEAAEEVEALDNEDETELAWDEASDQEYPFGAEASDDERADSLEEAEDLGFDLDDEFDESDETEDSELDEGEAHPTLLEMLDAADLVTESSYAEETLNKLEDAAEGEDLYVFELDEGENQPPAAPKTIAQERAEWRAQVDALARETGLDVPFVEAFLTEYNAALMPRHPGIIDPRGVKFIQVQVPLQGAAIAIDFLTGGRAGSLASFLTGLGLSGERLSTGRRLLEGGLFVLSMAGGGGNIATDVVDLAKLGMSLLRLGARGARNLAHLARISNFGARAFLLMFSRLRKIDPRRIGELLRRIREARASGTTLRLTDGEAQLMRELDEAFREYSGPAAKAAKIVQPTARAFMFLNRQQPLVLGRLLGRAWTKPAAKMPTAALQQAEDMAASIALRIGRHWQAALPQGRPNALAVCQRVFASLKSAIGAGTQFNANTYVRQRLYDAWRARAMKRIGADAALVRNLKEHAGIIVGRNPKTGNWTIHIRTKGPNASRVQTHIDFDHFIVAHEKAVADALRLNDARPLISTIDMGNLQLMTARENRNFIEEIRKAAAQWDSSP